MHRYLSWSLWQMYLLVYWPTRFQRDVEDIGRHAIKRGRRLLYLLKMLPLLVVLSCLGNLIIGTSIEAIGITYNWDQSWVGVAYGIAIGGVATVSGGKAIGVASTVAFGVAGGVELGVTGSVSGGVSTGVTVGVIVAMASSAEVGIAIGVMICVLFGVANDLGDSTVDELAVGIAFVMAFGMVTSVRYGVSQGVLSGIIGGLAFGMMGLTAFFTGFDLRILVDSGGMVALFPLVAFPLAFWLHYFRLLSYPFEIALCMATYFVGKQWPPLVSKSWQWCPVAWNEVIWLPLPFAGRLLTLLVRHDRTEGFKQIAFVAAERGLQRRVAIGALVEVAIDDLYAQSAPELAIVTDRLGWTTDAPTALPAELAVALPRFDRAAQHVGQFLSLHNAYRKSEALSSAEQEIGALQRSLIAGRGRYVTRLLQVANQWRQILEEERKALPQAPRELPNPFVFGNAVVETEHNLFTGRQDIARRIESDLLGTVHTPMLLLHGPRRMGKTSLLNQLPRLLGPDGAPTVVDCQNPALLGSPATLLRYISRAIFDGLRRRRVAREPLTAAALEREPFAAFDEWLDGVERAMPERMRVLLCLDEYERLQAALDAGWGAAFLDALRHTLQHRPRIALLFTGSHTFAEMGPAWTDRFISARRVRIGLLTRDEVIPLLTRPIPEFDMTYAPGALEALIDATNGQPFLTQAVAFELVQLLNEHQRKEATPGDVEAAIARALVSGGEYFANVWSDAGAAGQAFLHTVARGETPPEEPAARSWLREHDVLTAAGTFVVPMVERWVQQKSE